MKDCCAWCAHCFKNNRGLAECNNPIGDHYDDEYIEDPEGDTCCCIEPCEERYDKEF